MKKNSVMPQDALRHYEDFLANWKEADADLPIFKQAKAEYEVTLSKSALPTHSSSQIVLRPKLGCDRLRLETAGYDDCDNEDASQGDTYLFVRYFVT